MPLHNADGCENAPTPAGLWGEVGGKFFVRVIIVSLRHPPKSFNPLCTRIGEPAVIG